MNQFQIHSDTSTRIRVAIGGLLFACLIVAGPRLFTMWLRLWI